MITMKKFQNKDIFLADASNQYKNQDMMDKMLIEGMVFNGFKNYKPTQFKSSGQHEGYHFSYKPLDIDVLLTMPSNSTPMQDNIYIAFLHIIENNIVKAEENVKDFLKLREYLNTLINDYQLLKAAELVRDKAKIANKMPSVKIKERC